MPLAGRAAAYPTRPRVSALSIISFNIAYGTVAAIPPGPHVHKNRFREFHLADAPTTHLQVEIPISRSRVRYQSLFDFRRYQLPDIR